MKKKIHKLPSLTSKSMRITEDALDQEAFMSAKAYDKMIPWENRLKREIPFMVECFHPGKVLDVACSSGRHSFELEKYGFHSLGIDVSGEMIFIAQRLKAKKNAKSEFLAMDVTKPILPGIKEMGLDSLYDNALFVGNAIANMGNLESGKQVIYNIYLMLKPGGRFVCQTVYRPSEPYYLPLRKFEEDFLIQRIMIPVKDESVEHNVDLHVNKIDTTKGNYESQKADNHFFMYTKQEFEDIVTKQGFTVVEVFGGYDREPVREEDGATLVWILEKPEIPIYDETRALFSNYWEKINRQSENELALDEKIRSNAMEVWQEALSINNYRCIGGFRFLYPRITSHPLYKEITRELTGKKILDVGCHMGTDLRQLIVDGAEPDKLIGNDLTKRYWELGRHLFGDEEENNIKFIPGDFRSVEILDVENKSGILAPDMGNFD
ncbi:MAG: methyltransferase domain-containing protein, partial [Candidatus Heimdallarchaeota archaeon]